MHALRIPKSLQAIPVLNRTSRFGILCTAAFPRQVVSLMRRGHTTTAQGAGPQHGSTDEDVRIEDEGIYDMILPDNLSKQPLSHVQKRPVPSHIPRPVYATPEAIRQFHEIGKSCETWEGDGRIAPGSAEEKQLRAAASLAARALSTVGELIAQRVSEKLAPRLTILC